MSKAKTSAQAAVEKKAAVTSAEKPVVETSAPRKTNVRITAAKGRPMLTWVGRRPLGKAFNVVLSDVPEKKTDLVRGSYELPAPEGETTVVVKIIDMMGEEVPVAKVV